MKNISKLILLLLSATIFAACSDDDKPAIQPSEITDLKVTPLPGQIQIDWTNVEPISYEYLEVKYFDHLTKKDVKVLASQYAKNMIIPNTRAKYGDYTFIFQPFSSTKTAGKVSEIKGKSGIAPKVITVVGSKKIELTAEQLFTDAQEPSEGPIKDLLDGNTGTYFHARWSHPQGPMPHYIVVDLGKKVSGLKFSYTTRNHSASGNHPKKIDVFVSNEFDGETYDVSNLLKVTSLEELPNGAAQTFNSPDYYENFDQAYRYLWIQVKETHGGTKYFALSELSVSEIELKIIDPEAPDAE